MGSSKIRGYETGSSDQGLAGKNLGMATKYLEEISCAIRGAPKDPFFGQPTTDECGWHAFGALVQVIAGLLDHIETMDY